ncbi:glycosyltransferase [Lentimicrobium sp. L6]|uniref:glycosyltransferase family 2 protein n=1 Tax=Lentimicrobium sp. L6 TaxID=2735916 RepID=UPI001556B8FA|nr:glycosyltransferase [Lentimicrobium sp. L6]NPD85782.1 glycosyltransferase [Lentimicrobium sp. L6]
MLQKISRFSRDISFKPAFSLIIPSWNNLPYLKLCVKSIRRNSDLKHQIIIILNEANDGSLEWVKEQSDLDYVYAQENIGICYGLNSTRQLLKSEYILYANDDMYLLPHWDQYLMEEVKNIGHAEFMLSSTMIEPFETRNKSVIVAPFGERLEDFREEELLANFEALEKTDWKGSTWPPNLMHRDMWDLVGGMSPEFHPGMYSDPDLSKKFWDAGVREFKGVAKSRVYHFGSKSTGRVKKNKGAHTFLMKWGMTSGSFTKYFLERGEDYTGKTATPGMSSSKKFLNKLKGLKSLMGS